MNEIYNDARIKKFFSRAAKSILKPQTLRDFTSVKTFGALINIFPSTPASNKHMMDGILSIACLKVTIDLLRNLFSGSQLNYRLTVSPLLAIHSRNNYSAFTTRIRR